jgi:ketosteroid isomerase-like protein
MRGLVDRVSDGAVIDFNEAINRRDLHALEDLMTDDHTFIDSAGGVVTGKKAVLKAWEGFFADFPDYRNEWSKVVQKDGALVALGRSVCATEPALDGPAIWTAETRQDKVSEWRVFEDTPANRQLLGV